MHDLHARGALAQHRERVEQALDARTRARPAPRGPSPALHAIALVVDDQRRPIGLVRQQVDHAGDERLARRRVANANGCSRRTLPRRRDAARRAALASAPPIRRGDLLALLARSRAGRARARRSRRSCGEGAGRAKSNVSSSAVHERAARPRLERRRAVAGRARAARLLAHPQHPFQVVAIAAALELGQRAVAERRMRGSAAPGAAAGAGGPALGRGGTDGASAAVRCTGDRAFGRARPRGRHARSAGGADWSRGDATSPGARPRAAAASAGAPPTGAARASAGRGREPPARRRSAASAGPSQEAWRAACALGPALEVDRAAQQQPLARAGHRDVEDPVLLFGFRARGAPRRSSS